MPYSTVPYRTALGNWTVPTSLPPWEEFRQPWEILRGHRRWCRSCRHRMPLPFTSPSFTMEHLRTSGLHTSTTIPGPSRALITSTVTSLFRQAVTMRGEAPRSVAWSLVFLFPTLVMGPHRPGVASSAVRSETEARIDLWQRGKLSELASKVLSAKLEHPPSTRSKKAKAARRAVALLRHNQFARVA